MKIDWEIDWVKLIKQKEGTQKSLIGVFEHSISFPNMCSNHNIK